MRRSGRSGVLGLGIACAWAVVAQHVDAAPGVSFGPSTSVAAPTLVNGFGIFSGLASDGEGWLVAYNSELPGATLLRQIGADGKVTGGPTFAHSTRTNAFRLAHDGVSYIGAWQDNSAAPPTWHLGRFGADGSRLGEIGAFDGASKYVDDVALEGGEQSALAVACGYSGCSTRIITANGFVEGDSLPASQRVSAAYSDGTWLVVTGTETGLLLSQLGGDGTLIEGTPTTVDGPLGAQAIGTSNGFALTWRQDNKIRLATVDFDGAISLIPSDIPAPLGTWGTPWLRSFNGKNYLFASYYDGSQVVQVMQRLSATFERVGDIVLNVPPAAMFAVSNGSSIFGVDTTASPLNGATLQFGDDITASAPQPLSARPQTQGHLLGSPAPQGWLVVWAEGGNKWKIRAARLDSDGQPTGDAFDLGLIDENSLPTQLARGPGGWLLAEQDSFGNALYFLADDSTTLSLVSRQPYNEASVVLVGSDAGWASVVFKTDGGLDYSYYLERYTSERFVLERTLLGTRKDTSWVDVAVQKNKYFVSLATVDGKLMYRTLPTTGTLGEVTFQPLFDPKTDQTYFSVSNTGWWGFTRDALFEPQAIHQFAQKRSNPSDQLAFDGAALQVYERFASTGLDRPASALLAEPTTDFSAVSGVPSLFAARFSERSGNRALLLGYERPSFPQSESFQRAVFSTVEVTGLEPVGGAGGAGGEPAIAMGGAAEMGAGAPGTTLSEGGVPGMMSADAGNGPQTKPEDGNAPHVGGSSQGGDATRVSEGGVNDADFTEPGGAHGPRTSKGCGCRAAGVATDTSSTLPLLLLGALLVRRRRTIPS